MLKKHPFLARNLIERHLIQFSKFTAFFSGYLKQKIVTASLIFEKNKNVLVRMFIMKRGRYSRPFLHIATMLVLGLGVIFSPVLASTYPVFSQVSEESPTVEASPEAQSIIAGEDVFGTQVSQKPRDKVISYRAQRGDTLSTIAQKFGISTDTIKWENDLTSDSLTVGDELKILPVTGVLVKVLSGDTVYTIAKRYDTNPQKIVDWTFNDFANPETFSLVTGQNLIVPDGVPPAKKPAQPARPQVFIAQAPSSVSSGGFSWPLSGGLSQYYTWYHPGIDITQPVGAPVLAATGGTVSSVSVGSYDGGYGTNLYLDAGNGYVTHYAHLSGVNVGVGQRVSAGSVIGWVGLTGRTTGAHLHFEVLQNGALLNPLGFLP
jgi:murein DD-endopeptidase MepM/ murein hydrolase activator NlpD